MLLQPLLMNLKMIDFAEYNREREIENKHLIFGIWIIWIIWIDLEGRAVSSVNSGYLFSWN